MIGSMPGHAATALLALVCQAGCSGIVEPQAGEPLPLQRDSLVTAANLSCLLSETGVPTCWGSPAAPTTPGEGTLRFRTISGGWDHLCGLRGDSTAYCWGNNQYGQLGDGSRAARPDPTRVATDLKFIAIAAAVHATCALEATGRAYCWGRNDFGALGNGEMAEGAVRLLPTPVSSVVRFRTISGAWPICAISTSGVPHCWGSIPGSFTDLYIAPGDCTTTYYLWFEGRGCTTPTPLKGNVLLQSVSNGKCGLGLASEVYCWGDGFYGQLGNGQFRSHAINPVPVTGSRRYRSVSAGTFHACALDIDGQAFCWGLNSAGQLGNGADGGPDRLPVGEAEPVAVLTDERFTAIAAGDHTCALTTSRSIFCWGGAFGNRPQAVEL